ncbi:DNA cytosine methyltransferase [Neomicrococcus lactis]|uniref:Cytosine-specific methyltransferase n=1 Tax=Neomicrococcus lactis TaxID=732241 RepID=A0A7W9DBS4_9MICC|nr:DNA cytosine methyltransferase [Neomicrococcus lactis]MBB5598955.1 DNA (cytosine-5)-methyltransferase 1 [Neomicrococcus lactis]
MSDALTLIDLFAGAGGMTQGFHETGRFKTVAAVEMDQHAAATYSLNHEVDQLFAGSIEDWLEGSNVPQVDVVIGGPPCQGFSALGKQDVLDERNFLWKKYAETIVLAKPKFFVLENVRQFLKSPQFSDFEAATLPGNLLQDYELQPYLLNAADFGAYQSRTRTIVIGRLRELPEVTMPMGDFVGSHRTVDDAFADIEPSVSRTSFPDVAFDFNNREVPGPFRTSDLHVTRNYTSLSLSRFERIPAGGNRFNIPFELLSECWKKHKSGSGDVMGRLYWDKPSVTIRTEFFKPEKGRYLHPDPSVHRAITHFEAARLQGFPDWYQWAGTKVSIARQIGNAVPVQLARALGDIVANQFAESESRSDEKSAA